MSDLTDSTRREQGVVDDFLARYSGPTLRTYAAGMRRFASWCSDNDLTLRKARRADLERYSRFLRDSEGLKTSTIHSYLCIVSAFYRVATEDGYTKKDPARMLRKPHVRYDQNRLSGLSRHDFEKLAIHASERSPKHLALVILLGMLALRVSEACSVRIEDFSRYERGHRVLHIVGKGGRPATIPLPPLVFSALDACAAGRKEGPLLRTRTGRVPTRHDAYRWLRVLGKQAGLGDIHPHQLRHSAVTAALDAGATARETQDLGRWSDGRMVDHYDRNRGILDRHPAYRLSAHFSSIADKIAA